jgi:hypothetical protein
MFHPLGRKTWVLSVQPFRLDPNTLSYNSHYEPSLPFSAGQLVVASLSILTAFSHLVSTSSCPLKVCRRSFLILHHRVVPSLSYMTHHLEVFSLQVLVGAGASILGNVKIGEAAKIGASALVLTDIPAHATAVGSPAKVGPASTTVQLNFVSKKNPLYFVPPSICFHMSEYGSICPIFGGLR